MNKTAIKNFAIWARNKLIADISYKAGLLGITDEEIHKPAQAAQGVEFYQIDKSGARQYEVKGKEIKQRKALADKINEKAKQSDYATAYKAVIEEVAYTWFNRLIAVRFMEVNDYLPSRIRVLSSTTGKTEPDIVTTPFDTDLDFSAAEREYIIACMNDNRLDELFRMLFIKQCNALNALLPELFEKTDDYTELLLNISFTDKDGVLWHLINDITEDDFKEAVEIIGWLYQYYNTEPKDETFALLKKNVKITKERIPAATQLFTPRWIVRYMVENSLGRLWLEGQPPPSADGTPFVREGGRDTLKANWKYYLDEAEQTPEVEVQLEKIRAERRGQSPEDITFIDPCMGSGHILVYAFDVFMQIYESAGYSQRDAARLILEKNLHGLDIDKRAYQLAYFALFMKARQYNRRIFDGSVAPQVYHPAGWVDGEEYGSLLKVDDLGEKPEPIVGQQNLFDEDYQTVLRVWNFKRLLSQKYDIVCTNPPYAKRVNTSSKMNNYLTINYENAHQDLYVAFIKQINDLMNFNSYCSMITQTGFLFKSQNKSFRKLLSRIIGFNNIIRLGPGAFEEIKGEVVQSALFTFKKGIFNSYAFQYMDLFNQQGAITKEKRYLQLVVNFNNPMIYNKDNNPDYLFIANSNENGNIMNVAAKIGCQPGSNLINFWWEVDRNNEQYVPYNKGGQYRKWYGNLFWVLRYGIDGAYVINASGQLSNKSWYFNEHISWTRVSSRLNMRYYDSNCSFDNTSPAIFSDIYYLLGYYNSNVCETKRLSSYAANKIESGYINALAPINPSKEIKKQIVRFTNDNISLSRADWDSFETSWDFKRHPLIPTPEERSKHND
ncbi:MAG: BREX-1 system adenine-specific DNA-methyltransferase PglX [Oscillospiraceae bacterium]|nr:BREX-1 system adenine-specific DNA-methyltransferase PglX [Oscillospiraceae bacterium]